MEEPTVQGENPSKLSEFKGLQICLRCYKKPALKDGSEEGEYYCAECITIRGTIDRSKPVYPKEKFDPWAKNEKDSKL